MILFGLRDIGSANACLLVIEMLKSKEVPLSIYAEGPVYERFKDKFSFISECKMSLLLDSIKPSLVVATCATVGGAIPMDLTREAKIRNLPVLLVEDMWVAHSAFVWDIFPDGVCVTDDFAKKLLLQSWPNYPEPHIYITGSPVFDKFANMDVESAKGKLREGLDLSEKWPIIFFPVTGQISMMTQVIRMLILALNNLRVSVYLILRDHPSVSASQASEYREALRNLKRVQIIDSSSLNGNEVNAGADIVVGTFSTMTVEACYMRKPVIIIWTPEIAQTLREATNNSLAEWPITNFGAAMKAESVSEIKDCLQKIFGGNTNSMIKAQEKHFKSDGLSADRIVDVILSYY